MFCYYSWVDGDGWDIQSAAGMQRYHSDGSLSLQMIVS